MFAGFGFSAEINVPLFASGCVLCLRQTRELIGSTGNRISGIDRWMKSCPPLHFSFSLNSNSTVYLAHLADGISLSKMAFCFHIARLCLSITVGLGRYSATYGDIANTSSHSRQAEPSPGLWCAGGRLRFDAIKWLGVRKGCIISVILRAKNLGICCELVTPFL